MKKDLLLLLVLILCAFPGTASAAYHSFDYAAGLSPTEVVDKTQLEGWITKVEYKYSRFRILDPRGFERMVTTKPGTIGDYRLGDHVKVVIDRDRLIASDIQKI